MTNKQGDSKVFYIIYALIVIGFLVVLGVYDYSRENTALNSEVEEPKQTESQTVPAEEQTFSPQVQTVTPTNSQATTEELLADLPTEIDLDSAALILVNPDHPFETIPEPEVIVDEMTGQEYSTLAADAYAALTEASSAAGHDLVLVSGYRSAEIQEHNRNNMKSVYMQGGMSEEEAEASVNEYVAPTNASEHTTGLSIDVVDSEWYDLTGNGLMDEYAQRPSAEWLEQEAPNYGWILRYPEGKQDITFYAYEPWHYRYVGVEHAKYMQKHGLTLEEYVILAEERERLVGE